MTANVNNRPNIVNVGSINMDLVVRSPRIPAPGETVIGGEFHTAPGGKGANQSVAAARAGASVAHIGRVGEDDFGAALLANMAASGVDCSRVAVDEAHPTGIALIVVEEGGENSIVVASGANMQVSIQDIQENKDLFESARILLLQLETPLETVANAAHLAQNSGCKVVLNPAPAQELPEELLRHVDILIPNESETRMLTGLSVEDEAHLKTAASRLLDLGIETVILTLGERGARIIRRDGSQHIPPFKVVPVDTTAAGDAFVGAFAAALAEGRPLEQAALWGNAAGALAVTKLGAQPSLPARTEIERLLSSE